jgi:rare lipoprotein A
MRVRIFRRGAGSAMVFLVAGLAGCGHHKKTSQVPQMAPPIETRQAEAPAAVANIPPARSPQTSRIPPTPVPPGGITAEDIRYVNTHPPIQSEVGLATWYSAPYKGRKAANGEVFDDAALTAAHRTLPMGSLIVATNLKTGQWSAMRITDRGPFVDGRILDLTIASAKATGVYRAGLVRVRVDVYQTPKPIETGGRWCVQIGAFHTEELALKLKAQLQNRYPGANVIEFSGTDSYWVRIRPQGDNRELAETIASWLRPIEGEAFLTRLD